MKRIVSFFVVIATVCCCFAVEIGASGDIGFVQDVLISKTSVQADFDFRVEINPGLEMRVPVCLDFSTSNILIESGIDVVYYPWEKGFFAGLSVLRFGWLKDKVSDSTFYSLNQIEIGWTFKIAAGFFFEPVVSIKDPSRVQSEEYSALLGEFNNYKTFRFKAKFGWKKSI